MKSSDGRRTTESKAATLLRSCLHGAYSELALVRYRRSPSDDKELEALLRELDKAQEFLGRFERVVEAARAFVGPHDWAGSIGGPDIAANQRAHEFCGGP